MNTRIQVPLSPPEPHFEDEATVVSARQVVPLDQARIQDGRRKILAILPMLLAATLCGALGAVAVNYFAHRSSAPTVSQPPTIDAKPERQQVAPAPSPNNAVTPPADSKEVADNSQPSRSSVANDSSAGSTAETPKSAKPESVTTTARKTSTPPDPKQLVRQRRVHPDRPQAGQNDQPRARGAAKIQDIFSGPNP